MSLLYMSSIAQIRSRVVLSLRSQSLSLIIVLRGTYQYILYLVRVLIRAAICSQELRLLYVLDQLLQQRLISLSIIQCFLSTSIITLVRVRITLLIRMSIQTRYRSQPFQYRLYMLYSVSSSLPLIIIVIRSLPFKVTLIL